MHSRRLLHSCCAFARCLITLLLLSGAVSQAWGQAHIDVAVRAVNGQLIAEFCSSPALGCDSFPVLEQFGLDPTELPIDTSTGRLIFVSDFGDAAGGPFSTDDPGFQGLAGWLPPNIFLSYEALDALAYWDPVARTWSNAVAGDTRVRLFGGLPPEALSTDPILCGGLPFCFIDVGSTVFTGAGIEEYSSLIIDSSSGLGALHAHLDWFLETPAGTAGGAVGAYLLSIRITGPDLTPSDPFMVMLNNGLSTDEFAAAIQARLSFAVSATSTGNGDISPTSALVRFGETAAFTVAPIEGYSVADVSGCSGSLAGDVYTTGPISAACAVTASFSLNEYAVTATAGAGGSITPSQQMVTHGDVASFTVTPLAGFSTTSVVGCSGSLSGTTYVTGAITAACTVVATFTSDAVTITHTVTAAAGPGGRIEPGTVVVGDGETASFTVTPDAGYGIGAVVGCAGALNGQVYTTATVMSDCAVMASFERNSYSISATAGPGGTVTPAMAVVSHGDSTSFSLFPDAGYAVAGVAGCGGVVDGNVFTTSPITGVCSVVVSFEIARPTFEPAAPAPYDLDASDLFTALPNEVAPRAFDSDGAPLEVTLEGSPAYFAPGNHVLTWRAVDGHGAMATVDQVLRVHPVVSLGRDVDVGFTAGSTGSFSVTLNGPPADPPLSVSYVIAGYSSGHDLVDGSVSFADGETRKDVLFSVTETATPGIPDQEVIVTLGGGLNSDALDELRVRLLTTNAVPVVTIEADQNGNRQPTFARDAGAVTLRAHIVDPDAADSHTVQWQWPPELTASANDRELTIDPLSVAAGIYYFDARVIDDGTPPQTARGGFYLVLTDAPVGLPQGAAAWLDNGLPDHPDYSPVTANALPARRQQLQSFMLEAEPGVRLALGALAVSTGTMQAEIANALTLPTDAIANVGGYFDFDVMGLGRPGSSVRVVIPQRAPIPVGAIYRKYSHAGQTWRTFIETANDRLASAPGAEGYCPSPGDAAYRPGLNAGDWCVQLMIEDGGPNDGDGQRNAAIADPGGVGTAQQANPRAPVRPPSGGAGSSGYVSIGVLCVLLLGRYVRRRRQRASLPVTPRSRG